MNSHEDATRCNPLCACAIEKEIIGLCYYPGICPEGLKRSMKNLSQDSRCPGRDSKQVPQKCKSVALQLEPTDSIGAVSDVDAGTDTWSSVPCARALHLQPRPYTSAKPPEFERRTWASPLSFSTGDHLRVTKKRIKPQSGVGMATGSGSVRFFLSPRGPDRFWGPPSLLSNAYQGSFHGAKRQECEADHHLNLVPRSRKR
jgi:hypothetical protein